MYIYPSVCLSVWPPSSHLFPTRHCVGFLFLVLYPVRLLRLPTMSLTLSHTHSFVTHHLSHTQLCHCHAPSFTHTHKHRALSHTQLCHTHTTYSHTIFHIQLQLGQLCHAQLRHTQLCHTPSFVAGVALADICPRMSLFGLAGTVLGDIDARFAGLRATSTPVLLGRRGTRRH